MWTKQYECKQASGPKEGTAKQPGRWEPYLSADCVVKNADQEDVLHHQPAGHGRARRTGTQEDVGQHAVHVLPAVGHVQLL